MTDRTAISPGSRLSGWWSAIILLVAVLAWLTPTILSLHRRWSSAAIEYGYLVVLLALFLVYKAVRRSPLVISRGGGIWMLSFAAVLGAMFVSDVIGIALVPQLLFPALLVALSGLVFGPDLARRLAMPAAFLYFTIPFWQAFEYIGWNGIPLNETLRQITVFVASGAVRITGISALIEGDLIVLPSGTIEIADGCSGRAYFLTALELSAFYALAFLTSNARRIQLVAIACGLALLGNWIRVFSLTMIGYYSDMQHSLVTDHADFGWLVFCVTTLPFVVLGRRLEDRESRPSALASHELIKSVTVGSQRWIVAATLVTVAAVFATNFARHGARGIDAPDWDAMQVSAGWRRAGKWPTDWYPLFPAADGEWSGWFRHGDHYVGAYVADYAYQAQSHEVFHFDNDPAAGRQSRAAGLVETAYSGESSPVVFRALEPSDPVSGRLIWVAYRVAGKYVTGGLRAKLAQLTGLLAGRRDAQAFVLTSECLGDCARAAERIRQFVVDNGSSIFSEIRVPTEREVAESTEHDRAGD